MTNPDIDSLLWKEALGDASNIRGTDYHLLYAVWLLLCRKVSSVRFFAGNDLLVTPTAPVSPDSEESKSTQLIAAPTADSDEWVQLKSTALAWTVSKILEGNLLSNFVCNSFRSESENKTWNVRLITTQEIRSDKLRSFAKVPGEQTKCKQALNAIVTRLHKVLPQFSEAVIRRRAIEIIKNLANEVPVHRNALVAEINEALGRQFAGDRELAIAASRRIQAALLEDASSSPGVIRVYDLEWLSKVTDHDFTTSYPLNESILKACDQQVAQHNANQSHPFRAELCISRQGPDGALQEFLDSAVPLFVLTGVSGMGKSWTLMRWASEILNGHPRVIVSRPDPLNLSLESLIHTALALLAPPRMNDREILSKLAAAGNSEFGPAIIIVDDLRPEGTQRVRCADQLGRLVREAQAAGLKLVISCQADLLRNLHPFSHVQSSLVFDQNPQGAKSIGSATSDPPPSHSMLVFSDDELQRAVQNRLDEPDPEVMALLLRDPTYAELRHPYTLDAVFSAEHVATANVLDSLTQQGLGRLIDDRIEESIGEAAKYTGFDSNDVRLAFERVVELLCDSGYSPQSRRQVTDVVVAAVGSDGDAITRGLAHFGLLSFGPAAEIPDGRMQARLFAKLIHSKNLTVVAINERLSDADSELVSALVTSAENPAQFAADLFRIDKKWIGPAAEGLVACDHPSDPCVYASLLALARQDSDAWHAQDALGRLALRSELARKDLVRRFVHTDEDDRSLAQSALWSIARYAPKVVIQAVQLQFRLSLNRLSAIRGGLKRDDWKSERRSLGRAIRVLENIDSKAAAAEILKFLPKYESLATDQFAEDEVQFAAFDFLLQKYDETRVVASSFADPEAFQRFLADLRSDDFVKRIRAVNALQAVAPLCRDDVSRTVIECVKREADPVLLSRLLWQAYRATQQDPDAVMSALSVNPERLWSEYGTAAAALSLLEVLLSTDPAKALVIVPERYSKLSTEVRALLGELTALVRIRAAAFDEASFLSHLVPESGEQCVEKLLPLLEFHQLRAKAAALILSAIAESKLADWPRVWRLELRECGTDFFKIGFGPWIEKANIASLPDAA
ncbi:MAG: hypothetical protein ABSH28_13460, partial [Acidobacteriota bacterium]